MNRLNSQRFPMMFALLLWIGSGVTAGQSSDLDRLVAALLSDTPLIRDLRELTDEIGGRPTGSEANLKSVKWGLSKFEEAGITAREEAFDMPELWLEKSAFAIISGDVSFEPRVVSMPFSTPTPENGLTAPLVDGGLGSEADFNRLGKRAKGAFLLIETRELLDIEGLFRDYADASLIEKRAFQRDVAGIVYMSSRPNGLLYRHNASLGPANEHPLLVMEREHAMRAFRLLRSGKRLQLTARIDLVTGGPYPSYNVIGEIRGSTSPAEIVIVGAHLDSWGLGTGANDNGCNVAMMIDIARQIRRLDLRPKRTIRFALWNGEEQGLNGSWGYTRTHAAELENHVLAVSIDIGSGRINGFFTNGRPEVLKEVSRVLAPVEGLGPFTHIDVPIVGTDNFDFMLEGIANLVGNHDDFNYGPNYHAESDTFDKVDLRQLRLNSAIVAALVFGFANADIPWARQSRSEIERLMRSTTLEQQMKSMGFWEPWQKGERGRQ